MVTRLVFLLFVLSSLTAGACANGDERFATVARPADQNGDPAASLRMRAKELWAARQGRDCSVMFAYEDPSVSPAVAKETFLTGCAKDAFKITKYVIGDVLTDGDFGWVFVDRSTVYQPAPNPQPVELDDWEKWHRVRGTWYPIPLRELANYPESPKLRNGDEEKRLRARFEECWIAHQSSNLHRVYEMVDPKDRAVISEGKFTESEGMIHYLSHELHWLEVVDDRARIRVSYHHKLNDPNMTKMPPRTFPITEYWVKRDGEWYRDLKRS